MLTFVLVYILISCFMAGAVYGGDGPPVLGLAWPVLLFVVLYLVGVAFGVWLQKVSDSI